MDPYDIITGDQIITFAPPATDASIARIERRTGFKCPFSYRDFLQQCNGCRPRRGVFAAAIDDERNGQTYDENYDALISELFACDAHDTHDILLHQNDYRLSRWVPTHVVAIGWAPGVSQLLLDAITGNIYEWCMPTSNPADYGRDEWLIFAEPVANSFAEFWQKLRLVSDE